MASVPGGLVALGALTRGDLIAWWLVSLIAAICLVALVPGQSCSLQRAVDWCPLQVTLLMRRRDDVMLILASDGLWDVFSNVEACIMAVEM